MTFATFLLLQNVCRRKCVGRIYTDASRANVNNFLNRPGTLRPERQWSVPRGKGFTENDLEYISPVVQL